MRMTRSKTGNRRAQRGVLVPEFTEKEGVTVLRHHLNPKTGEYRGKQITLRSMTRSKKRKEIAEAKNVEKTVEQKDTVAETLQPDDVGVFDSAK